MLAGWRTSFTQNHYAEVPPGIGCGGCHGPGRQHVETQQAGGAPEAEPDPAIVNPARLNRRAQLSVCQQYHLASITVFAPGEGPISFKPVEVLAENRAAYVPEPQLTDPDWTGIDSHPLRPARSAYFQSSDLTCATCHDPHQPAAAMTRADYNTTCQSCHSAPTAPEALCAHPQAQTTAEVATGDGVASALGAAAVTVSGAAPQGGADAASP